MSTSSKTIILLKSFEGETFEIEEAVALQSQTIKNMIEDNCADTGIPLPNVSSNILAKVIEYCKRHAEAPEKSSDGAEKSSCDQDIKTFDTEFLKVNQATLFYLIMAANYLNINSLLDLTCQSAADMIKDKSPEEVRKIFNIVNDFTPEEEKQVRQENAWAYE